MTNMLKAFTLSAICFVLGSGIGAADYTGEISVGSVTVSPGEQGAVPVNLSNNNMDIMALTVPLQFAGADLMVDSVSFVGGLKPSNMNALVNIDNFSGRVRFTLTPAGGEPLISGAGGLLASIYFSVEAGALDQTVAVDSVCRLDHDQPPVLWTRLEIADNSGSAVFLPGFTAGAIEILTPMGIEADGARLPVAFELMQNFPNPFNPSTTIAFSLPERALVTLTVYNILGQEIEKLIDDRLEAGRHTASWNAEPYASGVYFYRLTNNNQALTKKMTLLK